LQCLELSKDERVVGDEQACSLNLEGSTGRQKLNVNGCLLPLLLGHILGPKLPEWIDDGLGLGNEEAEDSNDDLIWEMRERLVETCARSSIPRNGRSLSQLLASARARRLRRGFLGPFDAVCF